MWLFGCALFQKYRERRGCGLYPADHIIHVQVHIDFKVNWWFVLGQNTPCTHLSSGYYHSSSSLLLLPPSLPPFLVTSTHTYMYSLSLPPSSIHTSVSVAAAGCINWSLVALYLSSFSIFFTSPPTIPPSCCSVSFSDCLSFNDL